MIYSNTNKSYSEWEPKYNIHFINNKFCWLYIPYEKIAIKVGDELIEEYKKHQKFNLLVKDLPRYKFGVFQTIKSYLNAKSFNIIVEYNKFDNNHCQTIRMRKF
jgi:hypothetical protein